MYHQFATVGNANASDLRGMGASPDHEIRQPFVTACNAAEPSQTLQTAVNMPPTGSVRLSTALSRLARCRSLLTWGSCCTPLLYSSSLVCGCMQIRQQGHRRGARHQGARRSRQVRCSARPRPCSCPCSCPCSSARPCCTASKRTCTSTRPRHPAGSDQPAPRHGNLQDRRPLLLHLRPHRPGAQRAAQDLPNSFITPTPRRSSTGTIAKLYLENTSCTP